MISSTGTGGDRPLGSLDLEGAEELHDDGLAIRRRTAPSGRVAPATQSRGTGEHDPALPIGPVEAASANERDQPCAAGNEDGQPGHAGADVAATGMPSGLRCGDRLGSLRLWDADVAGPAGTEVVGVDGKGEVATKAIGRGAEGPGDEVTALVAEHLGEAVDLEGGRFQIGGHREVPLGVVAEVRRRRPVR